MGKKLAVKCTRLLRVCCGKSDCPAVSPEGFHCCRDDGHKGPHVACSHVRHSVAVWNDVGNTVSAGNSGDGGGQSDAD